MQLRVAPDDLTSAARLADDGAVLRGLAALLASARADTPAAAGGTGRLAQALDTFLETSAVGLGTLVEAVELLAGGFARAAQAYGATESAAAGALGAARG